jgi:hypothetical protein
MNSGLWRSIADLVRAGWCSRLGKDPGQERLSSGCSNIGLRRQPRWTLETELVLKHLFRRSESALHPALTR